MYAHCVEDDIPVWRENTPRPDWTPRHAKPQISLDDWCGATPWPKLYKVVKRSSFVSSTLRHEFAQLVSAWKTETAFISSDTRIVLHPAYQRIIGMGEKALPLIFEEMKENEGNWFWALRHITGANPVNKADVGKSKKMREVWLAWGRERHYL